MYAKVANGSIVKYPYTFDDLRQDNPQTSFPAAPSSDTLAEFGMVPVLVKGKPSYDPLTQAVEEGVPTYSGQQWEQNWVIRSATAQESAAYKAALQDSIVQATQQRLDAFAQTRQYDGILSACTYATSPTPKFAAEGQYCVAQRDATWAKLYQMMAEVEAGTRPVPSGFDDIESELPALVWPV